LYGAKRRPNPIVNVFGSSSRGVSARSSENWKSLRLSQLPQVRSIIDEEIESAWLGKKSTVDALNAAVTRGNAYLDRIK
jgi:hypothetical protein